MSDALFRGAFARPLAVRQLLSAWLTVKLLAKVDWQSLEPVKVT